MTGVSKWGQVPKCPACDKSVYPVEQVWHKQNISIGSLSFDKFRCLPQTENLFTDNAFNVRCGAAGKH